MTTPEHNLERQLRQLPDAPLPEHLWQRVNGARVRMRRRRAAGVVATAVAVAALALLPTFHARHASDPSSPEPWPVASAPAPVVDVETELRALDRALQAGYARGASDAELEALWAQRRRLISDNEKPQQARLPGSLRI